MNMKSTEISTLNESEFSKIRVTIDEFIDTLISVYGRSSVQHYFHIIDFHLIDVLKDGICLPQFPSRDSNTLIICIKEYKIKCLLVIQQDIKLRVTCK